MSMKTILIAAALALALPAIAADADKAAPAQPAKAGAEKSAPAKDTKDMKKEDKIAVGKAKVPGKDAAGAESKESAVHTLRFERWVHDEDKE